jgi:hypothetical protein
MLVALVALVALVVGPAAARTSDLPTHRQGAQQLEDEGDELSADAVDRIVQKLADAGIETDAATLTELAADLGVGGAVRALAWADASGTTADEILAMRADGEGWGVIRRTLDPDGEFGLHPGIGWIMRGADDETTDADAQAQTGGSPQVKPDHGRPDDPGAHGRARAADNGND